MSQLALTLTWVLWLVAVPVLPANGAAAPFPDKAKARIVISQDRQRMLIYEGQQVVRTFPISTGWPGSRKTSTPAWIGKVGQFWGTFSSFGTTQDLGYWLFTDHLADGNWNGDILVHGAPYSPGPNGEKVYDQDRIGIAPSSHGCIQLRVEDAEWFHAWDPVGVPIAIESFTRDINLYPRIVFGAQLAGTMSSDNQPARISTSTNP